MLKNNRIFLLILTFFFLQGCAGVRNSYESLLEPGLAKPLITLKVGEKREVLAVGNGLPGWWGYFPAIASHDPAVADITCKEGRSLIPFREPGIIFGGKRCYIEARKAGVAWLLPGNQLMLRNMISETDFSKVTGEEGYPPGRDKQWIKLKVVE